ncbi:MAG: hypothetical protein AB8G05_14175 [Oligoflexales bacterium]
MTAITGCHYFSKDVQYFSSTAFWVNSRLHPVATVSKTLTETQNPALVPDYFRLLGFKVPNLPVGRQLEQISTLVIAQNATWTAGFYNFIAIAQRYAPRETPDAVARRLTQDRNIDSVLNYFRSQGVRPPRGTYEQQLKAIQASIEPWPQSYKALAESSYATLGNKRDLTPPEISGNQVPIDLSSKQNHEQAIVSYIRADNIDRPLLVYAGKTDLELNTKNFKLEKQDGDLYQVSLTPAAKGLVERSILKPINEKIVKHRARQEFLKNETSNTDARFKQKNEDLEQLRSELKETNIERDQLVDELKKRFG